MLLATRRTNDAQDQVLLELRRLRETMEENHVLLVETIEELRETVDENQVDLQEELGDLRDTLKGRNTISSSVPFVHDVRDLRTLSLKDFHRKVNPNNVDAYLQAYEVRVNNRASQDLKESRLREKLLELAEVDTPP